MAWKPSRGSFWIACAALLVGAGCQEREQIRFYTAPKESAVDPAALRMLAVTAPRGQDIWFFKFLGPERVVSKHEEEFNALIQSVRFPDKGEAPVTWTTPEGWRQEPAAGLRYATLRFGPKDEAVEITVSKLGAEAGDVRQNVERWRGQLGLPALDDEDFKKLLNNIQMDGAPATRVDLVGGGLGAAAAVPAVAKPEKDQPPFHYTKPGGWEVRPADVKKGFRRPVVLRVGEAEVTAMVLAGDGGGVLANVTRWRGQIGLGPASEAEIRKDVRSIKIDKAESPYVDLAGPGPGAPQRILGVMLRHGDRTWFLTMKGPADQVGKQKAAFETFVQSIRFGGE